jgi:hypothetical protein
MAAARRVRGCVLFAVLLLFAAAGDTSARPRRSCVTIRTDETVASVAKRLTGDAGNMRAEWFQIVNPTTARWVPKARYGLRFAGWSACVVGAEEPAVVLQTVDVVTSVPLPSAPVRAIPTTGPVTPGESTVVSWMPVGAWCTVVLLLAFGNWFVDDFLAERDRKLRTMRGFADRFVEEFERPLIQEHLPHRPIQSRVRFRPGRSRFDVLLAPQGELRYPNLTDHKRNVIYDIVRIQRALSEHAFVSSRPYARGRWVVVPFQLRVDKREAGER